MGDGSERRVAMAGWVEVCGRSDRKEEMEEEWSEGRWVLGSAVPVRAVDDVDGGRCGERALINVRRV